MRRQGKKDEIVCLCNNVRRSTIEEAIKGGADTLNKIFDRTSAGVGPCGGSCRRKIAPMLDQYLENKTFPAVIEDHKRGKRR